MSRLILGITLLMVYEIGLIALIIKYCIENDFEPRCLVVVILGYLSQNLASKVIAKLVFVGHKRVL